MTSFNVWKLPENTLFERIKQHYLTGYKIQGEDEKIRLRWEAAFAIILDKTTDSEAARIHSRQAKISIRQAYIDIANAKNLFGDVRNSKKEAMRYLVTQWAVELFKKAEKAEDYYAAAKALEKIIKANNLDKEDQDLPDPSKIQPPVQLLSINFNFINTPWFKKIDPKAQEGLMDLHARFMKMIEDSPLKEYLNLLQSPTQIAEDVGD